MHLDLQTLSVVTAFVTALLGALLLFAGLQNRGVRAPLWWGAAYIVNAAAWRFGHGALRAPHRQRSTSLPRLFYSALD